MAKRQKSRFHYNDRSVLDRKGFEIAMNNEQRCVDWGFISEHLKNRMKHFLIENLQVVALKENDIINNTVGEIATLYTKSVISGKTVLD